jgi:hypothetical protein
MLAAQLAQLRGAVPAGLPEALDVVADVDDVLTRGLARVAEAVAAATAGAVTEEHLAALAGARSALLGAAHDALLDALDAALSRHRTPWTGPGLGIPEPAPALAGARAWLHEVALTGWRGVDHELVSGSAAPVEAALAAPELRRLAVLLDGFAAELRACVPVATLPQVPARRWADLWARAVLLARGAAAQVAQAEPVSGRLLPLGVDVHEHDTAVQVQLHALLEPAGGGTPRAVRVTVATFAAVWRLLEAHPVLLKALAERRAVTVTDLPLHGGDLRWDDTRTDLGEPADPFATARVLLATAAAAPTPPLDRHPAAIAEPVLVEGYTTRDDDGSLVLDVDGHPVAVTTDRLPAAGPLTRGLVAASTACLGLLRWDDGRWLLQPLAVRATVKRQTVEAHNGDWACGVTDPKVTKAEAKAGDAVAVLRERAGRLLRR